MLPFVFLVKLLIMNSVTVVSLFSTRILMRFHPERGHGGSASLRMLTWQGLSNLVKAKWDLLKERMKEGLGSQQSGRGLVLCAGLTHIPAMLTSAAFSVRQSGRNWLAAGLVLLTAAACPAEIIWSDLGATLAHETGPGSDILGGAVKRDRTATDTLYFKFHVNPISDAGTEPYFAAFELYEGDKERLAVGNALDAWAYGAFNVGEAVKTNFYIFENHKTNNTTSDYGVDLNSSKPWSAGGDVPYELPRKGIERTIVFKVQYIAGGKDLVTVWLDPDLGPGATEAGSCPLVRSPSCGQHWMIGSFVKSAKEGGRPLVLFPAEISQAPLKLVAT